MSDANTDSTHEPQIVATLFLPEVKSGRAQPIYGRSGARYSFKPSPRHGRVPVREYTSLEQFAREELDIRKNVRNPMAVCTMLGAVHPVNRAQEALESLIGARLNVPAGTRLETLEALQTRIAQAIAELKGGTAAGPSNPQIAQTDAETQPQSAEESEPIIVADNNAPQPEPVRDFQPATDTPEADPLTTEALAAAQPAAPESAAPDETVQTFTHAELMQMDMARLKEVAARFNITARSRKDIAAEILSKQGQ